MPTSDRPAIKTQQPPPAPEPKAKSNIKPRSPVIQYEYKLLAYMLAKAEDDFNMLGEQGWRFVGKENSGRAVFIREKP